MEKFKINCHHLSQKIVTNDSGTHCFLSFSSEDLGAFTVYSRSVYNFSYLEPVAITVVPGVFDSKLSLKVDSIDRIKR